MSKLIRNTCILPVLTLLGIIISSCTSKDIHNNVNKGLNNFTHVSGVHEVYIDKKTIVSKHHGKRKFRISFCEKAEFSGEIKIEISLDCNLDDKKKEIYISSIKKYHAKFSDLIFSSEILSELLIGESFCIFIVDNGTGFHYSKKFNNCYSFYFSDSGAAPQNEIMNAVSLFTIYSGIMNKVSHEMFHIKYLEKLSGSRTVENIHIVLMNEFLAHLVGSHVSQLVNNIHNSLAPIELNIVYGHDDNPEKCFEDSMEIVEHYSNLESLSTPYASSLAGSKLADKFINNVIEEKELLSIYITKLIEIFYLMDINELKTTLDNLARCSLHDDVTAKIKYELLDFGFSKRSDYILNHDKNDSDSTSDIMKNSTNSCLEYMQSSYLKIICLSELFNKLSLETSIVTDKEFFSTHKCCDAGRIEDSIRIMRSVNSSEKTKDILNSSTYTNHLHVNEAFNAVYDTGSMVNLINPPEDCKENGNKEVIQFFGFHGNMLNFPLCISREGAYYFRFADWTDTQILGIASIIENNTVLSKTPDYRQYEKLVIPYYYNKIPVFKIFDRSSSVYYNVCLDTGSRNSYLTRRYLRRKMISINSISKDIINYGRIDPRIHEFGLGDSGIHFRVLNSNNFEFCDIIMGADFGNIFVAIQVDKANLTVWIRDKIFSELLEF